MVALALTRGESQVVDDLLQRDEHLPRQQPAHLSRASMSAGILEPRVRIVRRTVRKL